MSASSQQGSGARGRRPRVPKYCRHKTWDLAYVRIGGRVKYLGPYNSPESLEGYSRLVAEFAAAPTSVEKVIAAAAEPEVMTVTVLCDSYLTFAEGYYRKDGRLTDQIGNVRRAIRMLRTLYSSTPAADFGPLGLKAIQAHMLANPGIHPKNKLPIHYTRGTINSTCDCIRRIFRWASSEELLPETIWNALKSVAGLKKGRCPAAREPAPVLPVADYVVDWTLPHLPFVVRDMVQFQRLTGARPGEVCRLRPVDLDRTFKVWRYRPASHKTEHHGRERIVFIGPRAQAILLPYLDGDRNVAAYCFSPAESEAKRLEVRSRTRKTPLRYGNRPGTNRKASPKRTPAACYNKDSYRRAIAKAINKANRQAEQKARLEQIQVDLIPLWKPNQLRRSGNGHPKQIRIRGCPKRSWGMPI